MTHLQITLLAPNQPAKGETATVLWHDVSGVILPIRNMSTLFTFQLNAVDGQARTGIFLTAHGPVHTPVFAPVGTQGTVKTLEPRDLQEARCDLILANAYHLYLRPGHQRIAELGGLHQFMQWPNPILTDSGGFQVFSLARQRHITDQGITFQSHLDGSQHFYSPQLAMTIQSSLGSDIAMVLDECAPPLDHDYLKAALAKTHRWAEVCLQVHDVKTQALFGIVQGGIFEDLRQASASFLAQLDFPGYGIGGLAVGETKEEMNRTLSFTCPALPESKPRYLMGVGAPEDIVDAVFHGVDMFDSVLPTRIARNGTVLRPDGRLNLRNAVHAASEEAIDANCPCYTCAQFSRAYLHHLVRCREVLGLRLCTIHNVVFMQELMRTIRQTIACGTFTEFRQAFKARYRISNQEARHEQRQRWLAARSGSTKPQSPAA